MKELAFHILDLVSNSLDAGAEHVKISLILEKNTYILTVSDDGKGMDPETLRMALEPGFSTKGTEGQGLPLVKELAEKTGGSFSVRSKAGEGTEITALFKKDSPFMIPAGKLGDALAPLLPEKAEIVISVKSEKGSTEISTAELMKDGSPDEVMAARKLINKNTDIFGGSVL